jgi:two-component system, chemotaxis family, protein-glutamate methylesterase/glutaminase
MINRVALIGGSAGSIKVVKAILTDLYLSESDAILICLHRLQSDTSSGLRDVLQYTSATPIIEPQDRQAIQGGRVYLAPANEHLVMEPDLCFSLSSSPLVQYSRPSIDVLFLSAAEVFQEKAVGILVTGANRDGALGMKSLRECGSTTIVQAPQDCFIDTMPRAAMAITAIDHVLDTASIRQWLINYFR